LSGDDGRPVVVMLDLTDCTLHRASRQHLVTRCGLEMDQCQVGPLRALVGRSAQLCTSCWAKGRDQLPLPLRTEGL
jgi:hypothetical protein